MPTATADIITALTGTDAELAEALVHTAGGEDHADRVFTQTSREYPAIANGMIRVQKAFGDARRGLNTATTSTHDALGVVREIADGDTPAEVTTRLNTAISRIGETEAAIEAVYPALDEAERVIQQVLHGGEPAPLLRFVKLANEAAARAKQQAGVAKARATAALPEVSNLGN